MPGCALLQQKQWPCPSDGQGHVRLAGASPRDPSMVIGDMAQGSRSLIRLALGLLVHVLIGDARLGNFAALAEALEDLGWD